MQEHHHATRPQLAAALGLSLVSTNAAVAALAKEGVLTQGDLRPSGGGRPVREYRFNPDHGAVAFFTTASEAHCILLHFELLNLHGEKIEEREARFVQMHAESLDDWLDAAARRHNLQRICLPPGLGQGILEHLQKRHRCPVQEYSAAEALAGQSENSLSLLLLKGREPQGAMRRNGAVTPLLQLRHLPLPEPWETLDYADHTLVEEMLARLLQVLTCTLSPARIDLHADFWNDRLIHRLDFNLSTKLRGITPPPLLHYFTITPETLARRLRQQIACR